MKEGKEGREVMKEGDGMKEWRERWNEERKERWDEGRKE